MLSKANLPSDYIPDDGQLMNLVARRLSWDLMELVAEIWPGLAWRERTPSALDTQWHELLGLSAAQWIQLKLLTLTQIRISVVYLR